MVRRRGTVAVTPLSVLGGGRLRNFSTVLSADEFQLFLDFEVVRFVWCAKVVSGRTAVMLGTELWSQVEAAIAPGGGRTGSGGLVAEGLVATAGTGIAPTAGDGWAWYA